MRLWNIDEMKSERAEQYVCGEHVNLALKTTNFVYVKAEVKSGKKEVIIATHLMMSPRYQGIVITSHNAKDCEEQEFELQQYGLKTIFGMNKKKNQELILALEDFYNKFSDLSEEGDIFRALCPDGLIVYRDEVDLGSGDKQNFANYFWKKLIELNNKYDYPVPVKLIGLSATGLEYENSDRRPTIVTFKPHGNYRGAKWFLDKGLVTEAVPFTSGKGLNVVPSHQAKEACDYWMQTNLPFAVVRYNNYWNLFGGKIGLKKFEQTMMRLYPRIAKVIFVGTHGDSFDWSAKETEIKSNSWYAYKKLVDPDRKILIVIDKTCKRSTEVAFHKHIAFWHDYRTENPTWATMAQAMLRVVHYDAVGHHVRVYARKDVFDAVSTNNFSAFKKAAIRTKTVDANESGKYDLTYVWMLLTKEEFDAPFEKGSLLRNQLDLIICENGTGYDVSFEDTKERIDKQITVGDFMKKHGIETINKFKRIQHDVKRFAHVTEDTILDIGNIVNSKMSTVRKSTISQNVASNSIADFIKGSRANADGGDGRNLVLVLWDGLPTKKIDKENIAWKGYWNIYNTRKAFDAIMKKTPFDYEKAKDVTEEDWDRIANNNTWQKDNPENKYRVLAVFSKKRAASVDKQMIVKPLDTSYNLPDYNISVQA